MTDDNLSQDGAMSDGRVDRSYLAVRNKAILEAYHHRGASYEQLAQHYGLLRASVRQLIQGSYGRTKQAAEPRPYSDQQSAPG